MYVVRYRMKHARGSASGGREAYEEGLPLQLHPRAQVGSQQGLAGCHMREGKHDCELSRSVCRPTCSRAYKINQVGGGAKTGTKEVVLVSCPDTPLSDYTLPH